MPRLKSNANHLCLCFFPKSPHLHVSPPGLLTTSYLTHSPPSLIHKSQALRDLAWGCF